MKNMQLYQSKWMEPYPQCEKRSTSGGFKHSLQYFKSSTLKGYEST